MTTVEKRELTFNGNEKEVYNTSESDKVIIRYKDVACAFNSIKIAAFKGKGIINNAVSAILFEELKKHGIDVHFIEKLNDREQLCMKLIPVPLQISVRNRISGTLVKRLGVEEGTKPKNVIVDIHLNDALLADPMINRDQAVALDLVSYEELDYIDKVSRQSNEILTDLFAKAQIELIDFKLEFGRNEDGKLIIADEISPDNCRLWDMNDGRKLDKDRFRNDLGGILDAYEEVLKRLENIKE